MSWRPNAANVWNETRLPLPEITGEKLFRFGDCCPAESTETSRILPEYRSLTTTSRTPPLASVTRLVDQVVNATYRPLSEIVGSTL